MHQQQRELYRQCDWLLVAAVVRQFPLRCLGVEYHIVCKVRQTRLNVTRCSSRIACEYVTPVSLAVNEIVLLSHLHQRTGNGCVAVRVILHGVSHHVRHLVVASVVKLAHSVQNASLHGLQTVVQVRHGTLQDNVRCVVQEPVAVHARELVSYALGLMVLAVLACTVGCVLSGAHVVDIIVKFVVVIHSLAMNCNAAVKDIRSINLRI